MHWVLGIAGATSADLQIPTFFSTVDYCILIYNFPYNIEEDDEDTVNENAELRGLVPSAIIT